MHILFLMSAFKVGGQEIVTNTLASHFIKQGHKVIIATLNKPAEEMELRVDARIPLIQVGSYQVCKKTIVPLTNLIRNFNADIVINQWGLPYIPAKILYQIKKHNPDLNFKTISVYHNRRSKVKL